MQFFEDDEPLDDGNCEHDNIEQYNGSMVCSDCGLEIEQVYIEQERGIDVNGNTKKFFRKKNQNSEGSISYECRLKGFSDKISDITDKKYQIMIQKALDKGFPETHRGRPRKSLICSCLFFSEMSQGYSSITLSEIGAKFDIYNQTKLGLGKEIYLKFFPEDANIRQKPIDLIPNVMIKAGIDLKYQPIIEKIMKTLENRSAVINASKTMSVAATMTFIFLRLNPVLQKKLGYKDVKVFSNKIKMSNITISKKSEEGLRILYEMQKIKDEANKIKENK